MATAQCDQMWRKFVHEAKFLKFIYSFMGVYFLPALVDFLCYWAYFNCYCKWGNIEKIIEPSGHTDEASLLSSLHYLNNNNS